MPKITTNPIWLVTKFEVIRQLKKPSFWIALLLLPMMILIPSTLSIINNSNLEKELSKSNDSIKQIGILDQSHIIANLPPSPGLQIHSFKDRQAGINAVKTGKLDVFYIIPTDFNQHTKLQLFAKPGAQHSLFSSEQYQIPLHNLLIASAASRVKPVDALILSKQYQVQSTFFDSDNQVTNPLGKAIIPIIVLGVFYILICVFGNRMLMTVTEEKENRISEMILTAISAKKLIIGKIFALIILGFLQIIIFIVPILALIFAYRNNPMVTNVISSIEFLPLPLIGNILLLLVSYFLFAGLSTLVGSLVPTARDAANYLGVVMIGLVMPIFFLNSFITNQTTVITYALSYFPLSAPISLMLRNAFGVLPWFEFVVGILEITLCSIIVLHLTVKSFQKNALNFSFTRPTFGLRHKWRR